MTESILQVAHTSHTHLIQQQLDHCGWYLQHGEIIILCKCNFCLRLIL